MKQVTPILVLQSIQRIEQGLSDNQRTTVSRIKINVQDVLKAIHKSISGCFLGRERLQYRRNHRVVSIDRLLVNGLANK